MNVMTEKMNWDEWNDVDEEEAGWNDVDEEEAGWNERMSVSKVVVPSACVR